MSLFDSDDVKAELAFDKATKFAGLHCEDGVIERAHHCALGKESQVAAFDLRLGIVRVFLGQLGEVLALTQSIQYRLSLLARLVLGQGLWLCIGIFLIFVLSRGRRRLS